MSNSAARRSSTRAASGRWRAKTAGTPGFRNTGLLGGDGFYAAAQERFVIEIDGRDYGERRPHHVSGIQTPAQPDFQHYPITPSSAKIRNAIAVTVSK